MSAGQGVEPDPEGTPLCAADDHDWEFQDDSFDHEFGTERVHYFLCQKCQATRGMEAGDYHEHDFYD